MDVFVEAIMEPNTDLEGYSPQDQGLNTKLPSLLNRWVQIRLPDWVVKQWEKGSR